MKNGYFTMAERVDLANKRFSDPSFVKELMTNVTSKAGMIDAIEKYNEDHNLNEKNRIKYSIGIGEIYINVIHAYKLSEETYAIIGRDNNGYGILTKQNDSSKSNTFDTTISTHIVDVNSITDVWFAGYDASKIGEILKPASNEVNGMTDSELEKTLTTLKTSLNSLESTGEYRLFFNKFTYEMKSKKLNEISYENKTKAYNIYTSIWVQYISMIKNIVANYKERGVNIYDFDKLRFGTVQNVYFIDTDDPENISTIVEEKINEFGYAPPQADIESLVDKISKRSFTVAEVETFKEIINGVDDDEPQDPDPQDPQNP